VSYRVDREIQALDQTAGFLRDDRVGVAALWDTISQLAGEPRSPESFPSCVLTFAGLAVIFRLPS